MKRVVFPFWSLQHLEIHSKKQTSASPPPPAFSGETGTPLHRLSSVVALCDFLLHLKTSDQMHLLWSPNIQKNDWGDTAEEIN